MSTTNFHEKQLAIADRRFEIGDETRTKNSNDFKPSNRPTAGRYSNGTTTKILAIAAEILKPRLPAAGRDCTD